MIVNELPYDKEDVKYLTFKHLIEGEPKNYNLQIDFPAPLLPKIDMLKFLKSELK